MRRGRRLRHRLRGTVPEDAVWEAAAGPLGFRHVGRAAITRWLAENPGHVEVAFYLASPPAITLLAPDRATARTSITELLRLRDTGELRQLFGSYSDELVRSDGRWRFAHRRFELRHQQPAATTGVAPYTPAPAAARMPRQHPRATTHHALSR